MLDVADLRAFYASPPGRMAMRLVARVIEARWPNCAGQSVLGLGYATPWLGRYRAHAVRVIAFMPAGQGVVNWPAAGVSSSALVDVGGLPLPDASIDRALVVHALENVEHPRALLEEVWRALTPGGRMLAVAAARRGLWAQAETTPFGQGQPFSRSQLHNLLRETLFSPIHSADALYAWPSRNRMLLAWAPGLERIGSRLALPGAGVHVVEATKQLYRPVGAGTRRAAPRLAPAHAHPAAGRVARREA